MTYRLITDANNKQERPQNPRKNANIFEVITYSWMWNLFKTGRKRDLEENDLYTILDDYQSSSLGDELEMKWKTELENAKNANRNPSLSRALIRMIGAENMFYGFILFVDEIVLRMSQPLLIGGLLEYFNSDDSSQTDLKHAYICAFGLVSCMLISTFVHFTTFTSILNSGMKVRVACCSVVYRKALLLSHAALGDTTFGQMINLISKDASQFEETLLLGHFIWLGPLQTIVATYFVWQEIGVSSLLGIVTLVFFIPIQGYLGKKISELRSKTANKTDERVRLMNEIISGIQVIKMYTWEKPFASIIKHARKKEIRHINGSTFIKSIFSLFVSIQTKFQLFISILAYVFLGHYITVQKVFVITSFYHMLIRTMSVFFCQALGKLPAMLVSIKRIQTFLLLEEKKSISSTSADAVIDGDELMYDGDKTPEKNNDTPENRGVIISNVTAKWDDNQTSNTLENINLTVRPEQLVALIGPVGAGKSSLIQGILRELPLSEGSISVGGVISYASQEPWLFAGTVRQNILFDSKMDEKRYERVVHVCALYDDFKQFPRGDRTIVGERGVTLSGGQRARINLARAVYKQADVYLLDDPLSAVDTRVGKHIFEKCIEDHLDRKTCILVTHQIHYLTNVDRIVLMENSKILAQGSYRRLKSSGLDFVKLLGETSDETSVDPVPEPNGIVRNRNRNRGRAASPVLSVRRCSNEKIGKSIEEIEDDDERSEHHFLGGNSYHVYVSYVSAAGSTFRVLSMFFMFIVSQVLFTGTDYWITYWVNEEEHVSHRVGIASNDTSGTQDESDTLNESANFRQQCVSIYTILMAALIFMLVVKSLVCNSVFKRISTNLHEKMFDAIIRATMLFFNKNSSGRILNRFSMDIGVVDDILPEIFMDCLQSLVWIFGIVIVVGLVNIYLIIPSFIMGVIFYQFRNFYLLTTRSIKRLEAIALSPVFSHLSASIEGLTTIRAFEAQQILTNGFDTYQDLHTSASYLFSSCNQAFGIWLDMVCIFYMCVVVFSFLVTDKNFQSGDVGLAITQTIGLTGMVQWFIRQTSVLENQMTSVERVNDYANIPQEGTLQSLPEKKPPKDWPKMGKIAFQNVNFRYGPDEPYVLKNINFEIHPMEKVGIVGRTGAGKSSIIGALFRLAFNEGRIIIDDIEVHGLGLHDLRSKISIIPQEPVLFSGTMRKNLDPFDEYPDHVLWNALDEVELKVVLENLPGGLNSKMSESGSNFSVGQRQLVCLARALVRNNRILVLDEATANVDPQTDALIQNTIREKFRACTVLTIAHRLNTIIDSDKVLVMDAGTVVEFDHPQNLLRNKEGFFHKMVEQTGQTTAHMLHSLAEEV